MTRLVLDASVVVKWFVPEILVTADRRLFNAVSPAGLNLVWIEDIV